MTNAAPSPPATIDIEQLGLDAGAHLLLKHALAALPEGGRLAVRGSHPELAVHLRGWARAQGHGFEAGDPPVLVQGGAQAGRWRGAQQAGGPGTVSEHPPATWGLAARGAVVEASAPAFHFPLSTKHEIWSDDAARLYASAAAQQWDPASAIPWDTAFELPPEIEGAVVQIMTYLVENENAALLVPARFLGQIHPHFREVLQVLAIQVADEARHIEIFTRRAHLKGHGPGLSAAGGQASLKTLLEEPDFAMASFLLSVMGEGTFLHLLAFIEHHAPDPVTRMVAKLAAQDEARHVAFGMAHLQHHARQEPALLGRLAAAVQRRHDALAQTSGLNEEVFDALVLLAAGAWTPAAIAHGYAQVGALKAEMDAGRRGRLLKLGFAAEDASALSALHTRNFM